MWAQLFFLYFTFIGFSPRVLPSVLTQLNEQHLITVEDIATPEGYERLKVSNEGFGSYLRKMQLKKEKTVYLYNGTRKLNQTAQYAVLNISTGNKDLQQCADAVMRLRAEYLKTKNLPICFVDNANKKYQWHPLHYKNWQHYLETVYAMCGTISLQQQLKPQSWNQLIIGDVLIKGGSPGHAVIIMDAARHKQTGEIIFLLAQSYMPAQDMHLLQNLHSPQQSPWFKVNNNKTIATPEWMFYANQLRTWH